MYLNPDIYAQCNPYIRVKDMMNQKTFLVDGLYNLCGHAVDVEDIKFLLTLINRFLRVLCAVCRKHNISLQLTSLVFALN